MAVGAQKEAPIGRTDLLLQPRLPVHTGQHPCQQHISHFRYCGPIVWATSTSKYFGPLVWFIGNRLTPLAIAVNHRDHRHFKIHENLSFTR